jgi:hypothetical protein
MPKYIKQDSMFVTKRAVAVNFVENDLFTFTVKN